MCVRACVCSHLCLCCALASGTRLTPESRGADRDRPIRINYSGHTQGLLAHFSYTYSWEDQDEGHTNTHIHIHTTLTFRMKVSSVLLSMTRRTCDGRVPLNDMFEQTRTV